MLIARLHNSLFGTIERVLGDPVVTTLARVLVAGVLLVYFWKSALTKIGPGLFGIIELSAGAYAQILPKQMEAVSYDPSQLGTLDHVIVYAGTYAEFVLPALVVAGLFTRLAALGMIGFIAVMTWTDITQHGVDAATIGSWFDNNPGAIIADQRALWVFLFVVLVFKGPGPLSLDRLLGRIRGRR